MDLLQLRERADPTIRRYIFRHFRSPFGY